MREDASRSTITENPMKSLWQRFREQRPGARLLELEALFLMLIGGLLGAGGKSSLEQTNTLEFCTCLLYTSC